MKAQKERLAELLLVAGCCAFLFFVRLGAFGLLGADEPRYAQVAREMLARHDWVTPFLNGQPWLEKPPLYYWGAMLSYKVFGVSDWAARVPSALLASLMVLGVYAWAGRWRPAMRVDAALMAASAALVLAMARAASTDLPLAACFTLGMLAWWSFYKTGDRTWLLAFYGCIAAATLAKGPVAPVLAVLIIAAFAAVVREPESLLHTLWPPGIAVFLLVGMPWYVMVQMRTPQFLRVFFLEQNLARFGTNRYHHPQPFWYYLPVILAATAPWVVLVIAAAVSAVREWKRHAWHATDEDALRLFLLCWTLIPLVLFSISRSKLPAYILPAVLPLLILAADWAHSQAEQERRLPFWLAALHGALVAAMCASVLLLPHWLLKRPAPLPAMLTASLAGTLVLAGVVLALLARGWRMLCFATLAPLLLCVGFLLRPAAPAVDDSQSARPVDEFVRALGADPNQMVALYGTRRDLEYGLMFYRDRRVCVYRPLEPGQPEDVRIPAEEHLVIVREGQGTELAQLLAGRSVQFTGSYRLQHLEIYRVEAQPK